MNYILQLFGSAQGMDSGSRSLIQNNLDLINSPLKSCGRISANRKSVFKKYNYNFK